MTSADIVLSLLKVLVVILFLLNAAAIATWADRRQSAMVQDRVGPNRAVVYLPSWVMRALLFLPGFALGGGALASLALGLDARTAPERMALDAQLAVLVTWVSIVILGFYVRRKGAINAFEERVADADPRTVFYMGLVAHALAMAAVQMVSRQGALVGGQVARGLLAVVLLSGGFYAASRVPEGKVGLRLAGMLHAAADAVKLIWKEDFVPKNADRLLHGLAPMIAMFPALVTFAIVPFGDTLCFTDDGNKMLDWADVWNGLVGAMPASGECAGNAVSLQVADLNVGVLYLFALGSTGVIGAADRGLVQRQQVLAARRPARGQPDGQLRGRDGPVPRRPVHDHQQRAPGRHRRVAEPVRVGHLRPARRLLPVPRGPRRREASASRSISPRARARSSRVTSSSTRA
jgi:NADH-quinone oxidoreductase subunit H